MNGSGLSLILSVSAMLNESRLNVQNNHTYTLKKYKARIKIYLNYSNHFEISRNMSLLRLTIDSTEPFELFCHGHPKKANCDSALFLY